MFWLVDFTGVVQGVGFRPAVWRAATAMHLRGDVRNATDGVHVRLCADSRAEVEAFTEAVRRRLPPIARIDSVSIASTATPFDGLAAEGFVIAQSSTLDHARPTDVSPDCAICAECLADIDSHPARTGYPLTNCTNCGPRFSIVTSLPYDRPATSMDEFAMCAGCRREYTDPADRRFHAQPISCNSCGPRYSATLPSGATVGGAEAIADAAAATIAAGHAVVVKGLGGYNLLCDATSAEAVGALRRLKHRPRKPFAVMFGDAGQLSDYAASISPEEQAMIGGWRAPIVILPAHGARLSLPEAVAPGSSTLGCMLPHMGFHHMLMRRLGGRPVVVTSANRPGSPIMTDDADAVAYARENGLMVVSYNRRIVNRQDDSVVRFAGAEPLLLRRSRGFAPEPLPSPRPASGILAMGADITSQFALGRDSDIIQSPYIGSLTSGEATDALRGSIDSLSRLFEAERGIVVVDRHPRYESRRLGFELAAGEATVVEMWHHHAHAVATMVDRGIDGPVLAIVLDGTGLAPDGKIHGSELMVARLDSFETLAHGPFLAMPGGDAASREPWRMAVSLARRYSLGPLPRHIADGVGEEAVRIVGQMVDRGLNSPLSCGAGRLWDAVAALLGVALRNGYEAEAPLLLENLASKSADTAIYPGVGDADDPLDFAPIAAGIFADIAGGTDAADIAMRFHRSYAASWVEAIAAASSRTGLRQVVASGGVMQNSLFTSLVGAGLALRGIELLLPRRTPCNDACVAVGQLAYAAALRARGAI